jgi:hypothetical protein
MVWYNLQIGNWKLKYTALNPIEKDYPYCDKDKNILTKVSGKFEKGYFINEKTQEKSESSFRLINNTAYAKLNKTKEVANYKEVEVEEVSDLLTERQYLVECDSLLKELNDSGKALKFGFTNGNGFKVYKAYLYPSKIYSGYLFMALGTTQISEIIKEIDEVKNQKAKLNQIEISISGINRAKVEDLLQL